LGPRSNTLGWHFIHCESSFISSDAFGLGAVGAAGAVGAVASSAVLANIKHGALAAGMVGASLLAGSKWTSDCETTRALLIATTAGTGVGVIAD